MSGRNPYQSLSPRADVAAVKTFTLPVSGSVVLFGPEIDIVRTKEFQRLGGIKQLGTSYVVYRGALHTRFEHSIGALHEAERMLRAVESNPRDSYKVEDEARRLARLGALLHDLPHVPFGHTLEDEFHLLTRHDKNKKRIGRLLKTGAIAKVLTNSIGSDEFKELCRVLEAKEDKDFAELRYPFVGDIVGNTVCADLLDYVARDLRACGLECAIGERFLDYLTVNSGTDGLKADRARLVLNLNKRGMPRPDVESEVVKLLSYRYELAERVYFHHSKNAASVMIGRAVQEAGWATGPETPERLDRNFDWLSDEMLLQALANPDVESALGLAHDAEALGDRQLALDLAQGVLAHDLFKIAYLATWDDLPDAVRRISEEYSQPEERRALENQIARDAGLPDGSVLVHIPRHKMMRKDADVRVRTERDEVVKLHEWDAHHSRRLVSLNTAHERLWRVMAYVHPRHSDAIEVVRAAAEGRFLAASRYVPAPQPGATYRLALFKELARKWDLTSDDAEALEHAAYAPGEGRQAVEQEILAKIRDRRKASGLPRPRRRGNA
jgi:HD superfamily phosphohydrolase